MNTLEQHIAMVGATARMCDRQLTTAELKSWLRYFRAGRMVNLAEIGSIDDMRLAQRFCSCMRVGVLAATSAEQLWEAWLEVTADDSAAAHEAECRSAAEAFLQPPDLKARG
jgi:hypothetical protein